MNSKATPALIRKVLVSGVSLSVLMAISACGGADTGHQGGELDEVKANVPGFISDSPMIIAIEKGYFEDEGIKISKSRQSGPASIPLLASGQLDVSGGAAGAGLYNAISGGSALKIIADKGSNFPGSPSYEGLVVRKDLHDSGAVNDAGDLKGMTVALTSTDSVVEYNLAQYLDKFGLSIDDVDIKVMDAPTQVKSLQSKAIDAAEINEPALTTALSSGAATLLVGADEIDESEQIAVLMAGEKFLENKGLAVRFMKGYLRGAQDFESAFFGDADDEFRQRVIDILSENTTVKDRSLYDKMRFPYLSPDGSVNVGSLEKQMQYYVKKGTMKKALDLSGIVDLTYSEEAAEQIK